ncbi:MAG: hypothetical protein A3B78_01885 [Omnitrophica WOR_2 bacterium RIFCSPHIGHO2_02_FULL_67_20]|nr:MAG: hypothetical protein A3B78_01885 [Omnitrophica WOR_2 bacterium RIFCSPHIGHO2_02_FULL_67_20]
MASELPGIGGEERRRSVRLRTRLTTVFKSLTTGRVQRALTKDVSGHGACLVTDDLLEVGTPLEVEIKLPDHPTPVTCLAEVAWSTFRVDAQGPGKPKAETGIKFLSIDPKEHARIMQYARFNALPPSGPG